VVYSCVLYCALVKCQSEEAASRCEFNSRSLTNLLLILAGTTSPWPVSGGTDCNSLTHLFHDLLGSEVVRNDLFGSLKDGELVRVSFRLRQADAIQTYGVLQGTESWSMQSKIQNVQIAQYSSSTLKALAADHFKVAWFALIR
jgi:hypothetical protein